MTTQIFNLHVRPVAGDYLGREGKKLIKQLAGESPLNRVMPAAMINEVNHF
jgi:hypothetical protein